MSIKLSTVTLTIASLAVACAPTKRNYHKAIPANDIEKIVYYGSLAGSSHNTQPWKVSIPSDSCIYIYPDFNRQLKVVDPYARGVFISLGAFTENAIVSAKEMGYNCNLELNRNFTKGDYFAKLNITSKTRYKPLHKEILGRRTLRSEFCTKEIDDSDMAVLLKNTNAKYVSHSSTIGMFIKHNTLNAYRKQNEDTLVQEELAAWLRFSDRDALKHRDGLSTSGMEINGFAGFIVKHLFKPNFAKKKSFVEKGIAKTTDQVEHCAGWILISQKEDTPEAWFDTGRVYERINLRCKNLMIGFHPMNQIVEIPSYESALNSIIGEDGYVQFVARVGYVKSYPPPVSLRRNINDLIIK